MMKIWQSIAWIAWVLIILMATRIAFSQNNTVITLGNELNQQQREEILRLFGVEEDKVKILIVTNEEERKYLDGIAQKDHIGTRAISSAYVEILSEGQGICVETYNISWVTGEMYENALVTAGVTDARVIAAAPYPVSGTAALTGILKAFEEITGKTIHENQKKVANEEMIKTGKLGEEIGKEKATRFMREVKEEVIERGVKDPEEIKKVIIEIAGRFDIQLSQQQINDISELMREIRELNLDIDEIKRQLRSVQQGVKEISQNTGRIRSLLQKIIEMLQKIIESILEFIGRPNHSTLMKTFLDTPNRIGYNRVIKYGKG